MIDWNIRGGVLMRLLLALSAYVALIVSFVPMGSAFAAECQGGVSLLSENKFSATTIELQEFGNPTVVYSQRLHPCGVHYWCECLWDEQPPAGWKCVGWAETWPYPDYYDDVDERCHWIWRGPEHHCVEDEGCP